MKKYFYGLALSTTLALTVGCDSGGNSMVSPDADFYQQGMEAEKNGGPPASAGPQDGKVKTSSGPSAVSP